MRLALALLAIFVASLGITIAGENVIRLLPPLIVSDAEIDEGVRRFDAALTALERAKAG